MYRKELAYYFTTPVAYIVLALYGFGISLFLWVIPGEYNIIESGYSQVDGLFQISPWLMMIVCPALTMRLFAEERQTGIWDLIRTKPTPLWQLVSAKYLAALTLMLIGLLPNIIHYYIVSAIAEPIGNIDSGQFIGSFIGLLLLGGAFLSIGLVVASLTTNQITAYIVAVVAGLILYWICMKGFYVSISRGVIDLRDVLFFISIMVSGILISTLILCKK